MDERLNLVRKAVRRKPGAFELLMEQEKEYLYKMAFLYCREEQMALDKVAETVAKAYVGISKLKKPEYFRTWLTRILINEALLPDFRGYTVMKDQENARKLALFSYELEIGDEP